MPTIPTDLLARLRAAIADAKDDGHAYAVATRADLAALLALVEAPAVLTEDDLTMRVARAIFDARCPGIRWADEDAPAYLAAAKAAIGGMDPSALTVGAALADPRVQDGSHVVEYILGDEWLQLGKGGVRRWCLGAGWLPTGDRLWLDVYALPCRLAPLATADADPATRGAL